MDSHELTYSGRIHVRPLGRGIVLDDGRALEPDANEWVVKALREAGVLTEEDAWRTGSRDTEVVKLTLRVERPER